MLHDFVHPHPAEEHVEHYAQRLLAAQVGDQAGAARDVRQPFVLQRVGVSQQDQKPGGAGDRRGDGRVGGKVNTGFVRDSLAKMGQNILFPPTVKGWDGEEDWLNANTVLLRFNFGLAMATQQNNEFAKHSDVEHWLIAHDKTSADVDRGSLRRDCFSTAASRRDARSRMIDYMNRNERNEPKPFALRQSSVNSKVRGLLHLMMSMPEFQLA